MNDNPFTALHPPFNPTFSNQPYYVVLSAT